VVRPAWAVVAARHGRRALAEAPDGAAGLHAQQEAVAPASAEPVGPRAEHSASGPAVAASMA